jgi:hypothetical protein
MLSLTAALAISVAIVQMAIVPNLGADAVSTVRIQSLMK